MPYFVCVFVWLRLTIRSDCAFGEDGNEKFDIPGNATVTYTVTLMDFERVSGHLSWIACLQHRPVRFFVAKIVFFLWLFSIRVTPIR